MVYIPPGGLQIDAVLQPYDPPSGDAANFELSEGVVASISQRARARQSVTATTPVLANVSHRARARQGVTLEVPTAAWVSQRATARQSATAAAIVKAHVAQRARARQSAQAEIQVTREGTFGLRADIGPLNGQPIATIAPVIAASYRMAINEVSEWSMTLPISGPNVELVEDGMEIRLIRDGEDELIRGVIRDTHHEMTDQGPVLEVEGEGVERELVWANTLLGREFASVSTSAAVSTLLNGTPFSVGSVAGSGEVTGRFEGASIWQALDAVAQSQGLALRARSTDRLIDISELGTERDLRFIGVESVSQEYDRETIPVKSLSMERSNADVWTRVIPLGGGEQVSALTLQHSNRNSPYTRHQATGPDGQPYWYIQDNAAIAQYGVRTKVLKFDDVSPLSNSFAELRRAANALYDIAAGWLEHRSQRHERWTISVPGFRHRNVVTGEFRLLPGDRARVRYRGVATSMDGHRRLWADVNEMAWCRSLSRDMTADGDDRWDLEMASTLNIVDDDEVLAETVDAMWALATSVKHNVIETQAGPFFDSIDSGFPVRLGVIYDSDIRYLHRAKLNVRRYAIRADAKGAAAGGGQTTSSGGGQTTSSGGGSQQTTSSGGSTTQTTTSGGSSTPTTSTQPQQTTTSVEENPQDDTWDSGHFNRAAGLFIATSWEDPPFESFMAYLWRDHNFDYNEFGVKIGRHSTSPSPAFLYTWGGPHRHNVTIPSHNHSVSVPSHSHSVSIPNHQHSVSIPNHTHNVSDHTHQVSNHTHNLDYGIHQGSLPSNPQFQVWINGTNRTTALGGPWNSSEFELDITPYLVDSQGYVRQQRNTVEIRANNLQRVEVSCRSIVTIASTVPIG